MIVGKEMNAEVDHGHVERLVWLKGGVWIPG
jgi:hypothetical protein